MNVFFNIIKNIKKDSKIIYLAENQAWEKFLNFFCIEKKIDTFAYPHAGVRQLDLRYFLLHNKFLLNNYMPSKIISIGRDTEIWLKQISQQKKKIALESLRLNKKKFYIDINKKVQKVKNCLIFLDIYDTTDSPVLKIIYKLKYFKKIYLKLHPTADVKRFKKRYPYLKILNNQKIPNDINIIISGSNTTASYFAYYNRLPLFVFLRSGFINMTPFFENYKFNTFYDVKSLKEKLNKSSFKK